MPHSFGPQHAQNRRPEALRLIKGSERLKRIPVVILTTSKADEDVLNSYDLGANSYITKPVSFEGLIGVVKSLKDYWLGIVELPADRSAKA